MLKRKVKLSFLTVVGAFILTCTSNKEPNKMMDEFMIRTGVNVSHWLSQSDKRGEERKNYITKVDFDTIAAVGFDHVRIPIDEEQMWDSLGNKEPEAFELLHNAINWAMAAKLRVIVDLHIIRSHHFIAASNPLWTDPAEQQKLADLWQQLSEELSRKIVVGSNRWQIPDTFPDFNIPANDTNIILSFHFYTPMALTHHQASWTAIAEYSGSVNYPGQIVDTLNYQGLSESAVKMMRSYANGYFDKAILEKIMMPAIKVAKAQNLPLFCGEFGVYPSIQEDVMLRWYNDVCEIFNQNNIAYCHWCYKGDFPVVNEKSEPNRKLVAVLTAK